MHLGVFATSEMASADGFVPKTYLKTTLILDFRPKTCKKKGELKIFAGIFLPVIFIFLRKIIFKMLLALSDNNNRFISLYGHSCEPYIIHSVSSGFGDRLYLS